MSARNGDKARTDRLKKRRTQRRMRTRELAASVPVKAESTAAVETEAKPVPEKTA
jgi:DNA-binding XRE family transcriptional regulator